MLRCRWKPFMRKVSRGPANPLPLRTEQHSLMTASMALGEHS